MMDGQLQPAPLGIAKAPVAQENVLASGMDYYGVYLILIRLQYIKWNERRTWNKTNSVACHTEL